MAIAHAGAKESGMQLFQYLNDHNQKLLPVPMMNILNGRSHADNSVDIQEFMVMPFGQIRFLNPCRWGQKFFTILKQY